MRRSIYLLLIFITAPALGDPLSPNKAAEAIVAQITIPKSAIGLPRIIVPDMRNLDGSVTELGRLLSEEILQALFHNGNCDIVERLLLEKVIKEQKLAISGILDPTSTRQLGKILSADYVLVGILTDIGDAYKVHIRLISTITGALNQSASVELVKTRETQALDGRVIQKAAIGASGGTVARIRGLPPGTIYFETFSDYKEGDLLTNWGKDFMVNYSKLLSRNGLSLLSGVNNSTTTPQTFHFPKNFYIEAQAQLTADTFKFALHGSGKEFVCVIVYVNFNRFASLNVSGTEVVKKQLTPSRASEQCNITIRIVVYNGVCKVCLLSDENITYDNTLWDIWSGPMSANINSFGFEMNGKYSKISTLTSNIRIVALE